MLGTLALAQPFGGRAVAAESGPDSGAIASRVRAIAIRLRPGQDLRQELLALARQERLQAAFVMTAVGSLTQARLRLADQASASSFEGKFEIVSLVGTLGQDSSHLHLSLSDSTGKTIGGHLVDGNLVYTTAEIVIGEMEDVTFSRAPDPVSTFRELVIRRREKPRP